MRSFLRTILMLSGLALLTLVVTAAVVWAPRTAEESRQDVWTCSMHPQVRQAGPGRCPLCGMDLIPVSQLAAEQAQAGLETEPVAHRELFKELRTVGKLDYNERQVAYLTARIAGRVDHVYADFTGIAVKQADHLVDIYSPDLIVTEQNLLNGVRSGNQELAESARQRLLLWGMLPHQVRDIEKTGQTRTHLTIHAPLGGTVIEKAVREGQYVKEGDMLYRIADLDPLWLYLDVYESDLAWVRFGQPVDVAVEAYPGETFRGTAVFIDPFLDDRTRTVKVRVNLKNTDRRLKPAMYASAVIQVRLQGDGRPAPTGLEGKYICPMHPEIVRDQPGRCPVCGMDLERVPGSPAGPDPGRAGHGHGHAEHAHQAGETASPGLRLGTVLAVRASAVLDTGRRQIVYRQTEAGNYELVEPTLGPRAEGRDEAGKRAGYYPVLAGLRSGDRVAIRGGFLLDSQRQIEGMPSLLYAEGQSGAHLHAGHAGHGGSPPAQPPAGPAPGGAHKH